MPFLSKQISSPSLLVSYNLITSFPDKNTFQSAYLFQDFDCSFMFNSDFLRNVITNKLCQEYF